MEMTILPTVMATTMYLSALLSGTHAVPQTSPVAFTHVLPEKNVVAYTVKSGDTLKSIAHTYYEDESYWITLWNDNSTITDPENLPKGLRIRVRVQKPVQTEQLLPTLVQKNPEQKNTIDDDSVVASTTPAVTSTPMPTVIVPTTESATPTTSGADNGTPSSFDSVYKDAGAKYGVPWQILYGLHITESGGRDGAISSGHGPQGPMQFMPGTWTSYAVDGNGDGTADINNAVDAINTAANFIAKHGSVEAGLRSYGGNNAGVMRLAHERGFTN
jgi:Transglycosylase SLT domain/LysM domain